MSILNQPKPNGLYWVQIHRPHFNKIVSDWGLASITNGHFKWEFDFNGIVIAPITLKEIISRNIPIIPFT